MDMFLHLDGIPGESTQKGHEDWIALVSADFGVGRAATAGTGTVSGAGRTQFRPAMFTAWTSSATPLLFEACASRKRAATAAFEAVRTGDSPAVLVRWDFEDVLVLSLGTAGAEESPTMLDSFTLQYSRLRVTMPHEDPRGGAPSPGIRPGLRGAPPLDGPG